MQPTKLRASSEMNITPMIDVLLVLLVIFMASLPLSQKAFDVDLPAETAAVPNVINPQIVLEYQADRTIAINKQAVTLASLESRLREIFATRRDKTLYIAGGHHHGRDEDGNAVNQFKIRSSEFNGFPASNPEPRTQNPEKSPAAAMPQRRASFALVPSAFCLA